MTYRPITDLWILARAKLTDNQTYYGAYPGGFLERARALLGVSLNDPVLHVCGGKVRNYPYANAVGPNDKTLDLDPALHPDYLQDASQTYPTGFKAILADPPYSPADAAYYIPGETAYPAPNRIVANAIGALPIGGRVGILHYVWPQNNKEQSRQIAAIGVLVGQNNRIRCYSVFERTN